MPVRVSRWWQELTHPCKYLKNNNWRTSRPLPTYLIDNSNNHQGLANQRQSLSHLWSAIDTSSQSAIHTSQLRQPGDYLKYNKTRTLVPRVHTLMTETNGKKRNKIIKQLNSRRRTQNSKRQREIKMQYYRVQLYTDHKRNQNIVIRQKSEHCFNKPTVKIGQL